MRDKVDSRLLSEGGNMIYQDPPIAPDADEVEAAQDIIDAINAGDASLLGQLMGVVDEGEGEESGQDDS